jgi:GGDEF domain-containing protein
VSGRPDRPAGGSHVLEKMLQGIPPVTPRTPAGEVFAMFERTPDLRAVAVVREDAPIGLISRYDMVDNMARPYRHELYGRKPCTRFMDEEPLAVDIRLPLSELAEVVVRAHPRHLISGFIITDAGRYLGIGSVQDLVREVTAMQMEAAKYANPLTQLPGNVPINQYIDNLLAARAPCAIAYCDLDHFKPFNDVYGYARGDDVIRLTARVLGDVCDAEKDFIGHIGGDDFVLVFRSADWQARCARALDAFGAEILGFFARDDIERGGYVTENRKGELEFHALTSLSIGVAEVRPGMFRSHLEVSVVAAEVKKKAKNLKGNSLYVNQRAY